MPKKSETGRISMLRYPGGKRWFLPYAEHLVAGFRPEVFVEPFAGGATVGLTLLWRDRVEYLQLAELDNRVSAFWYRVLTDGSFPDEVEAFDCTRENVEAVVADKGSSNRAMWVLVKNRCSFGGNLEGGLLRKGDGRGVQSRWNGKNLADTMRKIQSLRHRIFFQKGDGIPLLTDHNYAKNVAFLDPPYTVKTTDAGHDFYRETELDHVALMERMKAWKGRWVATYNDSPHTEQLAVDAGFSTEKVLMRTTQHKPKLELLISREFSWLPGAEIEDPAA
jgi:DNA adenine methylase